MIPLFDTASSRLGMVFQKLSEQFFVTDGGLETELIFHDGYDLPCFAAFPLLESEKGRDHLRAYYRRYLDVALSHGYGFLLETPTWRAGADWGRQLDYSKEDLDRVNQFAVRFMRALAEEDRYKNVPVLLSGQLGPRGDGYEADDLMSADEAATYHRQQIASFRSAGVDLISAITMTNIPEAIGVANAAHAAGLPCVISFTVETDSSLPTGETLREAIEAVDSATETPPAYYMINCAHPTHLNNALEADGDWKRRIRAVRANASKCRHEELDAATELDDGHPAEFGQDSANLIKHFPNLKVFGGCCGTDVRHVAAVAAALV